MITETFGIENGGLRIEESVDNAFLNPQSSILNSLTRQKSK
jgi:hypothetical protein